MFLGGGLWNHSLKKRRHQAYPISPFRHISKWGNRRRLYVGLALFLHGLLLQDISDL